MDKKILDTRERRIGDLIALVSKKSGGFKKPPIVVIGGFALRSYLPFSRYSRDCDFAIAKTTGWVIDSIPSWLSGLSVEARVTIDDWGFMRLVHIVGAERVKVALDFMEGEIHGREGEVIRLDEEFINNSMSATISVGGKTVEIRVPSYLDFLLLKIVSCRPSDVRDIAALLWKHGSPDTKLLAKRARQIVISPQNLNDKLSTIIKDVSDERFIDSWRGTFLTTDFTPKDKQDVLKLLRQIKASMKT